MDIRSRAAEDRCVAKLVLDAKLAADKPPKQLKLTQAHWPRLLEAVGRWGAADWKRHASPGGLPAFLDTLTGA